MRSLVIATLLLPLLVAAPARAADLDGDTVQDADDNCLTRPNPGQQDSDGNGFGDACECGDVDADGTAGGADAALLALWLSGQAALPAAENCDVWYDGACNVADLAALLRTQAGLPGAEAVCAPATVVDVAQHGAVGDGVTWDHHALQAAIDAAGPGGLVLFRPGQVYNTCQPLFPQSGQIWWGFGATLQRCDSVQTTLVAPALAGQTSAQVADASGFEFWTHITVTSGPGEDDGDGAVGHVVNGVQGNTVEFSNGLLQDYAAGDLILSFSPMVVLATGSFGLQVIGLVIDGNRRANLDYVAWQRPAGLQLRGSRHRLRRNRFADSWSNAVFLHYADGAAIAWNRFEGGASAAVHLTSATNAVFEHNVFRGLNRDAELAGHSEGAITWSALNQEITVRDNCFHDIGAAALGRIGFHMNRGVLIERNEACSTQGFVTGRLTKDPFGGFQPTGDLIVRDNVALETGGSVLTSLAYTGASIESVDFSDNVMRNSYLDFENVDGLWIDANVIVMGDPGTWGDPDPDYGSRAGLVTLRRVFDAEVSQNDLAGGEKGLLVLNTDGVVVQDVLLEANQLLDQTRDALMVGHPDLVQEPDWQGEYGGVSVSGNTLSSLVLDAGEDVAVLGREVRVEQNCVESSQQGVRVHGEPVSTGIETTFYAGNTLAALSAPLAYESSADLNDLAITDNVLSEALDPAFAGGQGNLISGNGVDAGAGCAVVPPPPPPATCSCAGP